MTLKRLRPLTILFIMLFILGSIAPAAFSKQQPAERQQTALKQQQLEFSAAEQQWLNQQPVLTFSEVNWKPLSDVDHFPQYRGIIADYMQVITERSGIQFEFIESHSWFDVLEKFAGREIDMIPAMADTDDIGSEVLLTDPYISFPLVIVSRNDTDLVALASALNGKRVGVGKGYTSYFYLKHNYPQIILDQSTDVPEGLQQLKDGKTDAFVGHIAVVVHAINDKNLDLRISGFADYRFEHRIGISPQQPLAVSVINKVIASITPEDHSRIINQWFNLEISRFNYSFLGYFVAVVLTIIAIMYYRYNLVSTTNRTLYNMAHTDELTKLANRKHINAFIEECERNRENALSNHHCSLILIDIDDFKSVNDTYGHDVGDQVLVRFAEVLTRMTRHTDLIGRWGGEEFLIIFEGTHLAPAVNIAEKLRRAISEESFPVANQVTASFGVIETQKNESRIQAFSRLDSKLYEAKHSGKNCVVA